MDDLRNRVRSVMWDLVGIVRSDHRLEEAGEIIAEYRGEYEAMARGSRVTPDLLELRNLILCAQLVIAASLSRKESRGLNFNMDHPYRDNERFLRDTIVSR